MTNLQKGINLIAEPFLADPAFARTVVVLCAYDEKDGCFGFVIKRHTKKTLKDLKIGFQDFSWPLYDGGPVQKDSLHYLHQYPEFFPDAVKVTDDLFWGGDFDLLMSLVNEGKIERHKIKFFLGYSGWDAEQLEAEMEEHSWIISSATHKLTLQTKADDIWRQSLYDLGGKYKAFANFHTDPQLN